MVFKSRKTRTFDGKSIMLTPQQRNALVDVWKQGEYSTVGIEYKQMQTIRALIQKGMVARKRGKKDIVIATHIGAVFASLDNLFGDTSNDCFVGGEITPSPN